jgi:autotransporter-associated beta strand protein
MTFLMAMVQVTQPLQAATVWWAIETSTGTNPSNPVFSRTSGASTNIPSSQVQLGNNVITVASSTGLSVGQVITGSGIPAGTVTITEIISPTQIRISANGSSTITTTLSVTNPWTLTGNNFTSVAPNGTITSLGTWNNSGADVAAFGTMSGASTFSTTIGTISAASALNVAGLRFTNAGVNPITLNGSQANVTAGITEGSNTVTVASTTGLFAGQTITGVGIPEGSTITSVVPSSSLSSASVIANNNIVSLTSTAGLIVGQVISGTGIPTGTTITAIGPGNQITISNGGTQTITTNLTANPAITVSSSATQTLGSAGLRAVNSLAINLQGVTPKITLGHSIANDDAVNATTDVFANISAHLTGSNGLRVETVSPGPFTGTLTLGSATPGGVLPNQLTGGITIGGRTTVLAQTASNAAYNSILDNNSTNNPLGNNLITLEAGSTLNLSGTKTINGISGRLFNLSAYTDSSRIDFSQPATGEIVPTQSFITSGSSGQSLLTVTNTAVLRDDQLITGAGIPAGAQVRIVNGTTIEVVNSLSQPLNITAANPTITVLPTQPNPTMPNAPFFNTTAPQADARTSIRYNDANGATQTVANYGVQYVGNVNITSAGNYTFFARPDDAARIYLDGVLILNNDGGKGAIDLSSAAIPLGVGTHEIRVDYVQGTGGGSLELAYAVNNGLGSGATNTARTSLSGVILTRAETLSSTMASGAITLGNAVRLTGNAALNIQNTGSPSFIMGPLQIDNGTTLSSRLMTSATQEVAAGGDGFGPAIRFGGTTGSPSLLGHTGTTGTVNINANTGIAFDGVVSDGGRNMTLVKSGVGRLYFSGTTQQSTLGSGTTIEMVGTTLSGSGNAATIGTTSITSFNTNTTPVFAGMTVTGPNILPGTFVTQVTSPGTNATLTLSTRTTATGINTLNFTSAPSLVLTGGSAAGSFNPIGSAAIKLNGGNLFLDSTGATSAGLGATFVNNVDLVKSGFIRSMQNSATITLGGTQTMSGTTNSTITVSVASTAGLRVGQPVSGTGIPAGARIATIDSLTNTYTLTSAATSSVTGTLTYGTVISISPNQSLVLDAIAGGLPVGNPGATLKIASDLVGDPTTLITVRSTVLNGVTNLTRDEAEELGTPLRTGNNNVTRGVVALSGNNSAFLGTLNFEPDAGLRLEGVDSLNSRTFALNRNNTLTLAEDGDGTGGNQIFNFNHAITINNDNTLAVGRVGTDYFPYYAQAQNKTMQINTLTTGRNTVILANNNGYNLQVNGGTTLNGGLTLQVNNANDSNLLSGLRLSGAVTGSGSLLKSGGGTLSLENGGNTFGSISNITGTNAGPGGSTNANTLTTESVTNLVPGQLLTGAGIAANTRIANVNVQNFAGVGASGGNTLTLAVDPAGIFAVGMPVSGNGIAAGTTISSINNNVTTTTTGTSGNNTVTVSGGTFRPGEVLDASTGIPAGTYVLSVAGNVLTLSQDITSNNPTLVRRQVTLATTSPGQPITANDPTLALSQLVLSNSFTGTPSAVTATPVINITAGVVAANSDAALGNAANQILLNVNAATGAGLRATGTFSTARDIVLNQDNNAIEVTQGNTLTLNSAFQHTASNRGLRKNDLGTLVLTQPQTGWNGLLIAGQGSLQINNLGAFGSSGFVSSLNTFNGPRTIIAETGAEVALNVAGTNTINETFQLALLANRPFGGINSQGAIRNMAGNNTIVNPVHIAVSIADNQNNQAVIAGVDNGTSLALAGGTRFSWGGGGGQSNTYFLGANGTGIGTLAGPLANFHNTPASATLMKIGSGTWNFTDANVLKAELNATTTASSNVVTLGSTNGLSTGLVLHGNSSIPAGATITEIINDTQVRISLNATAATTAATTFGSAVGVAGGQTFNATTQIGNTDLTVPSTTGLLPGMGISGTGIPAGAVITQVLSGNSLRISAAATAAGTPTATIAASPVAAVSSTVNSNVVDVLNHTGFATGMTMMNNPNIPEGTTITALIAPSAGNGNKFQLQLSAPATVTAANVGTTFARPSVSTLSVAQGSLVLSGQGSLGGAGTISMNTGSMLRLDNTGTNVNDRLSRYTLLPFGAELSITGNAVAATSETLGHVILFNGKNTFTLEPNAAQPLKLILGNTSLVIGNATSVARATGTTALFRGTNLGNAEGNGVAAISGPVATSGLSFSGQTGATGTTNKGIVPWALVDTSSAGTGLSFATADAVAGASLTGTSLLRPLAPSEMVVNSLSNQANVSLNSTISLTENRSINSLTLQSGGRVNVTFPFTLTVDSGGVLAFAGNDGIRGGLLTTGAGRELVVHALGDTTISSTITGVTGGLTKSGAGMLTLGPLNAYTGTTAIAEGTLKLAAGTTNSIYFNNQMLISNGATLDLNGSALFTSGLFTDLSVSSSGLGASVVNTGVGQATLFSGVNGGNWGGSINGNIAVARGNTWIVNDAQGYTGGTFVLGGTTQLQAEGALTSTSAVTISRGTFGMQNALTYGGDMANRLNDTAPITMQGGRLFFQGRWGMNSTETVGAITLTGGQSLIDVFNAGLGVASAQLTAASLIQQAGSRATLHMRGFNGQAGSNARFLVTTPMPLSNHLIANAAGQTGWAVVGREWASYSAGTGIGQLDAVGYAGYAPNTGNTINTGGASDNLRVTIAAINASGIAGTDLLTVASTAGLQAGDVVQGVGVAPGTTIQQVTNATQLLLSQPITLNDPILTVGQVLTSSRTLNTLNLNTSRGTFLDLGANTLTLQGGGLIASLTADNSGTVNVLSSPAVPKTPAVPASPGVPAQAAVWAITIDRIPAGFDAGVGIFGRSIVSFNQLPDGNVEAILSGAPNTTFLTPRNVGFTRLDASEFVIRNGQITAGVSGVPSDLYVHSISSVAADISSRIFRLEANVVDNGPGGAVSLVLGGDESGGTQFVTRGSWVTGSNTHSGGTFVNSGTWTFHNPNADGINTYSIPGDLTITGGANNLDASTGFGGNVRWGSANQMKHTGTVTLNTGAFLDLNDFNQTVAGININNTGGSAPIFEFGAGRMTLNGNINATSSNASTVSVIRSGNVVLSTGTTQNSPVVTVGNTSNLIVGAVVSGTGIPGNTTIVSILDGTRVVLSANATATNPSTTTGPVNLTYAQVGRLDLNGATRTFNVSAVSTNGVNVAPLQPTLEISAPIVGTGAGIIKNGDGLLQLSGQSLFDGGVTVNGGGLVIGTSSNNSAAASGPGATIITGPLGSGTLTLASNSVLVSTNSTNTLANNVVANGNLRFDGLNSLTLNGTTSLSSTPTITVVYPSMTATFGGLVSGSTLIQKNGLGTLAFSSAFLPNGTLSNNTITGAVNVNEGTLRLVGPAGAATVAPLGTAAILLQGGVLDLRSNGASSEGTIVFGNNVQVHSSQTSAFINVDRVNANTFNTIQMGTLSMSAGQTLNVTSSNGYNLSFSGGSYTGTGVINFNPAVNSALTIGGGFTDTLTYNNTGLGSLILSGSNTNTNNTIIGPNTRLGVAPQVNTVSTPFGIGTTVTLQDGVNLPITPLGGMPQQSAIGYTSGGLTVKYASGGASNLNSAFGSGMTPVAVVPGQLPGDLGLNNRPAVVTTAAGTQAVYSGLLKIDAGGAYNFQIAAGDQAQLIIDGIPVAGFGADTTANATSDVGAVLRVDGTGSINLAPGYHSIVFKTNNLTGGGGHQLLYGGPDTVGNGLPIGLNGVTAPSENLQSIPASALYWTTDNATALNNFSSAAQINNSFIVPASAKVTLDGRGSDINSSVASLNLGNGATLTVNNQLGTGWIGVTGSTVVGSGVTLNTNSGTLNLIGGVTGNGLLKTGNGTLMLGGSSGTFTGDLTATRGFVQVTAPNALPTGTTSITRSSIAPAVISSGTENGKNTLTVADTSALKVGMQVSGAGVPANAYITGITNGTTFTISGNATATDTGASLTYGQSRLTFIGTTAQNSHNVTVSMDTTGLEPGMLITGGNVPAGTYITAVGSGSITLSQRLPNTGGIGVTNATLTILTDTYAAMDLSGTANVAGNILLNGVSPIFRNSITPATLFNSSSTPASVAGTVSIGALGAAIGGFGDISLNGAVSDSGNGIAKVGPSVLTLGANNTGLSGSIAVNAGILRLGNAGGLGVTGSRNLANASTTNANTTVTVESTTGLFVGQPISGTNIPANATITAINSPTSITISANATATGSGLTLSATSGVSVTATASLDMAGISTLAGGKSIFLNGTGMTAASGVNGASLQAALGNSGTAASVGNAIVLQSASAVGGFNGNITLAGIVSGSGSLTKVGSNTLTLTEANTNTGGINVNAGTLVASGAAGRLGGSGGGTNTVNMGAVLNLDNSSANLTNRLNTRPLTINGGTVNFTGSGSATSSEAISTGSLTFGAGGSVLNLTPGTNQAIQILLSGSGTVARSGTGTALITGKGIGGPLNGANTSTINYTTLPGGSIGAGTTTGANRRVLPWLLLNDTVSGVTTFASLTDAGAANAGLVQLITGTDTAAENTLTTGSNLVLTNNSNTAAAGLQSFNSITFDAGGELSVGASSVFLLDSGGILARSGTSSITGTGVFSPANSFNREFIIHALSGATLNLGTTGGGSPRIYSVTGLTKAGPGTLSLNTATTYNGNTVINGGTLRIGEVGQTLNKAVFTTYTTAPSVGNLGSLPSGQLLTINQGGTLDLNGSSQTFANLNSDGILPGTGGSIINSSGTPATLRIGTNGDRTWAGDISGTGTINLVRDGGSTMTIVSANTMTGSLTLQGGTLQLRDSGSFNAVSSINVRRSGLLWNDTAGLNALGTRLNTAATISLNSGSFEFRARNDSAGEAEIGQISLTGGASIISVTPSSGTAVLTIDSINATRGLGASVVFASSGSMGTNGNVFFNTAPTLVNGIIGAWAVALGVDPAAGGGNNVEFATYDPASGVRLSGNYLTTFSNATGITSGTAFENTNIKIGTVAGAGSTVTIGQGGATVNSLTLSGGTSTLLFTLPDDLLTVKSGGILAGLDNSTRTIGNLTAAAGRLTAGTGTQELFLHIGQGNLTVNSAIVDNTAPLNLIMNGLSQVAFVNSNAPVITLAGANTYTGSTYVNGVIVNLATLGANSIPGNLIISGGVNGVDSLPIGNSTVNISAASVPGTSIFDADQIANSATVTINGGARLQLNRFNETIGALVFNNDGGSNGNTGPTVDSAGGVLKVTGTITANDHSNANSIPVLNGFLDVTGGQTFAIADSSVIPGQIGLAINAALIGSGTMTKTGAGVLGLGGQSSFGGILNVNGGGLAISQATAFLGLGRVNLAGGTFIDTRGLSGAVIGSLTGTGTVQNYNLTTAGTLRVGYDNTNASFDGVFHSLFTQGRLNVEKIGTGTWTLNGNSSTAAGFGTSNNFAVSQGTVLLNSAAAQLNFISYNLNAGAALTLDNSTSVLSNRLGGATYTDISTNSAARTMTMTAGSLNILGGATAVTENLTTLSFTNGTSYVTLTPGAANATLNIVGAVTAAGTSGGTAVIRGPGLNGSGAGTGTVVAGTPTLIGGSGGANSTTMSIRPDILGDLSPTGFGTGFVTHVAGTGFRLLAANELKTPNSNSYLGATLPVVLSGLTANNVAGTENVLLNQPKDMHANTIVNSLTLSTTGGVVISGGLSATASPQGTLFGASGQMLALTVTSGGLLTLSGNTGIQGGRITADGNALILQGVADATINSYLAGTAGVVKSGPGTVTLGKASLNTGITTVNNGRLVLNGGANTLIMETLLNGVTTRDIRLNGGTLDLNGNSQVSGLLSSGSVLPGTGGTLTSTAPAIFINNSGASTATTTFAGTISGAVSYYKTGSNSGVSLFTAPQTYTGSTNILAGGLTIRDDATILNSSAINIRSATLTLENQGLASSSNRIGDSIPLNLSTGSIVVNGRQTFDTEQVGTVNLIQGASSITLAQIGNTTTGGYTLNIANLTRDASAGGVITFNAGTNLNLGGTADDANVGAQPRVFVNQMSGSAFDASSLTNGIIGGWAVVGGNNGALNTNSFATYQNDQGIGRLNSGAGFVGYGATDLNSNTIAVTANVSDNGNRTINRVNTTTTSAARILNSIRLANQDANQTITLGSGGRSVALSITSGGLMTDANRAMVINSGEFGSTLTSGSSHLYNWVLANTTSLNTSIVGNIGLVKSGAGTLSLAPSASVSSALGVLSQNVSTSSGSAAVTVADGTLFHVGMQISGNGNIPGGATVTAISGNTLTLSAAATASGDNVATTFGSTATVRVGSTEGMIVGMPVSGTGITAGSTVTAILGPKHYQLSAATTSNSTQTLVYNSAATSVSATVGVISKNLNTSINVANISVTDSSEFYVGMPITGNPNIPDGTTVAAIVDGTTIRLSSAPTATASGVATTFGTSNTVRITPSSAFALAAGMAVQGAQLPGGVSITQVLGNNHFLVSAPFSLTGGQSLTLTTQSNAYTGTTIVNQGTLNLNGTGPSITVPADLLINGGVVNENGRSGQISALSNIAINGAGVLNTFGGARTHASLALNANGGISAPAINFNSVAATVASLPNSGSTFVVPSVSGLAVGQIVTGSGNIVPGSTITAINAGTGEVTISNALTGTAGTNVGLTFFGGGSMNLTSANAISASSDNVANPPVIAGGTLQLSHAAPVITTSGVAPISLIINSAITSAGGNVSKMGNGSLMLGGQSTFNNGVTLNEGTLIFGAPSTGAAGAPTSGPLGTGQLTINGGTLMGAAPAVISTTTANGSAQVTVASGTGTLVAGMAVTGTNIPGGTTIAAILSPTLILLSQNATGTNATLNFTRAPGAIGNAVALNGDVTFGGMTSGNDMNLSGTVTLSGAQRTVTVTNPQVTATISGQITGASSGLTKAGNGILVLNNAANNYGGATTVLGGMLQMGAAGNLPATTALTVASGATFNLAGRAVTVSSLSGLTNSTGGIVTNSGGAAILTVNGSANNTFAGLITNAVSLVKSGSSTLTLPGVNSYTGTTTVNGGVLELGVFKASTFADSLGRANSTGADRILISNGTLRYTGGATATDKLFTIANPVIPATPSTATIEASGTGPLVMSNAGAIVNSTANQVRGLILSGSSAAGIVNIFNPILSNNGTALNTLTKTGSNTWAIAGNMGYTGTTSVNQGTLTLSRMNSAGAATGALNNTTINVLGGATLGVAVGSGANNSYTAGLTTTAAAGSTLSLQPGSLFTMSGDGQIGTFNLRQGSSMATGLTIDSNVSNITRLAFDIGSAAGQTDKIDVSRGVSISGGPSRILVNPLTGISSVAGGTYDLINISGAGGSPAPTVIGGSNLELASNVIVLSPTVAYNLALDISVATKVRLVVTAATINNVFWDGSAGTTWNNAANWSGDLAGTTAGVVPDAVDNVFFSINGGGANLNTTLGQAIRVGSLNFNSQASSPVTIGGTHTLTINSAVNVNAGSAAHTISAPVALGAQNTTWTVDGLSSPSVAS